MIAGVDSNALREDSILLEVKASGFGSETVLLLRLSNHVDFSVAVAELLVQNTGGEVRRNLVDIELKPGCFELSETSFTDDNGQNSKFEFRVKCGVSDVPFVLAGIVRGDELLNPPSKPTSAAKDKENKNRVAVAPPGIKMMITNADAIKLRAIGYSQTQIDFMTPEDVIRVLSGNRSANKAATQTADGDQEMRENLLDRWVKVPLVLDTKSTTLLVTSLSEGMKDGQQKQFHPLLQESHGSHSTADKGRPSTRQNKCAKDLPLMDSIEVAQAERNEWAAARGLPTQFTNNLGMQLWLIPPGRFFIGASGNDQFAEPDEEPAFPIDIENGFYASEFPLTFGQLRALLDSPKISHRARELLRNREFAPNLRCSEARELPASGLSGIDAERLAAWLGEIDNHCYLLPTEAEWEYMARAGTIEPFWWPNKRNGDGMAVFNLPSSQRSEPSRANPWGLIDVLGNVWEWTASEYRPYPDSANVRRELSAGSLSLTLRGGSFDSGAISAVRASCRRCARASYRGDDVGVRFIVPSDEFR